MSVAGGCAALTLLVVVLVLLPSGAISRSLRYVALMAAATLTFLALAAPRPRVQPATLPGKPRGVERAPLLPWFFAAFGLYLLITIIPLPLSVGSVASSERRAHNAAALEMIESIQSLDMVPPSRTGFSISRNRAGTVRWSMMALAAMAAALAGARLPPPGRRILLRLLLAIGTAVAIGGIYSLRVRPQGDTLWWIFPVDHGLPGPVACFRNRNHFAAFLAMLAPVALALGADDLARRRIVRSAFSFAALAVLTFGTVLTLSRGATLSLAVGFAAVLVISLVYRRWATAGILAVLGVAALAYGIHAAPADLRERFTSFRNLREDDSYQTRVAAWRDSARIVRSYPLMGTGANGFRLVYPQHRTTTQGAEMTHAENEYVQWAVDGGAIGWLLALALGVCFCAESAWPALRARSPDGAGITMAGLGSAAVIAANAFVDYPLHIPLYTITAGAILGCLMPLRADVPRRRSAPPALLLALLTVIVTAVWGRRMNDDAYRWVTRAPLAQQCRALAWAPTNQMAWFAIGERLATIRTPEATLLAAQCYTRAGALDPNNYRLWERIGYSRWRLGDLAGARAAFARVKELRDWKWVPEL